MEFEHGRGRRKDQSSGRYTAQFGGKILLRALWSIPQAGNFFFGGAVADLQEVDQECDLRIIIFRCDVVPFVPDRIKEWADLLHRRLTWTQPHQHPPSVVR